MATVVRIDQQSPIRLPSGAGWSYAQASTLLNPATEAYQEAVKLFSAELTHDERKRIWLQGKHDMKDVQKAVSEAKAMYERSKTSEARIWLDKLSSRIMLYGTVLDTLSQHHAEYVSLVWGAIKFMLVGILNQEELIKQLAKALCNIADALPHIELKIILYPTDAMKSLVATLYAHIIKFVQRAANWYKEGKMKHMLSAIARPYKLRFKDIVDDISEAARRVDRLAASLSMAEQREMHLKQHDTHTIVTEMRRFLEEQHKLQHSVQLDTSRRVCEIQFSQILTFAATTPLVSPETTRGMYVSMRNRRRRLKGMGPAPFRSTPQSLQAWATERQSSLIVFRGSFRVRNVLNDFVADTIDLIVDANIPAVWVLQTRNDGQYSSVDILKQLVLQVLQQNHTLLNERSAALNAARYQSATTEDEWFNILGSVLDGLAQIYIIVDAEMLNSGIDGRITWASAFQKLFDELGRRGVDTVVKVAIIGYKATTLNYLPKAVVDSAVQIPESKCKKAMAQAGKQRGRSNRNIKSMRLWPNSQLSSRSTVTSSNGVR